MPSAGRDEHDGAGRQGLVLAVEQESGSAALNMFDLPELVPVASAGAGPGMGMPVVGE